LKTPIARLDSEALSSAKRTTGYWGQRKRNRHVVPEAIKPPVRDEVLVIDDRASVRPAQAIESKLTRLLQEASVPVSHLQMRGMLTIR